MKSSKTFRFRFYDYEQSKWSFEHISPQNPKGSITIPEYAILYVVKEIENKLSDSNLTHEEKDRLRLVAQNIEANEKIDSEAVEFLFDSNVD